MKEDIVVEVCPHCGTEVEMRWDVKADGYKAFCPYCGMRLMLCDACQHPDGEYNGGTCDYCSSTDRCKHNDIGWIGVGDKYPPDQEEVLVCTRAKNGVRNIDKGYFAIDRFIHRGRSEVTHWMPLPELPEEVEQ